MKNVTISLDDEVHRNARIRAAEMGTSLSALVKGFLVSLSDGPVGLPEVSGVREMPMTFKHQPAEAATSAPSGPPWFIDGKWVYTPDGKPRQPGAMRGMGGWTEDFDQWPDGFIDAIYGDDTEAANTWWKPFAAPPTKPNFE